MNVRSEYNTLKMNDDNHIKELLIALAPILIYAIVVLYLKYRQNKD